MKRILCSDRTLWSAETFASALKEILGVTFWPFRSVKMAGYWPCFFAFLWTSTSSRSIKTQ